MARTAPRSRRAVSPQAASRRTLAVYRRSLADGVTPGGWLAVEGPIMVADALRMAAADAEAGLGPESSLRIHSVLATERAADRLAAPLRALPRGAEITLVPERLFKRVAMTETPRGIAALVELPQRSFDAVMNQAGALAVIACGLQDPGNIGTIMRSAHALGAAALVTLQKTVSPFNPKALR